MSSRSRAARAAATVSAATVLAAAAVLVTAAPAAANTPVGWEPTDAMSLLDALLLFVGGPLLIALALVALVMAPSAIRGGEQAGRSGQSRWSEPLWFGGGDAGRAAPGAHRTALEAPSSSPSSSSMTEPGGGAGARW